MTDYNVMIVDDEVKLCRNIALRLKREGYATIEAHKGETALRKIRESRIHLVILDYMLTDTTGLEVLKQIKAASPGTEVLMLTAYGNIENAVLAMKWGAADYLNKPFDLDELAGVVGRTLRSAREASEEVVSASPRMRAVFDVLTRIAPTEAPVLLLGEHGVGKSTLARWIHRRSAKKTGPFAAAACDATTEDGLERELFGSGGKVEEANGGTLFLDEVAALTPMLQAKLLYLAERGTYAPPGETRPRAANVRLVAASAQPLKRAVAEGKFREDLYYRLNVVEVEIPPLRERTEDIPALARRKLDELNRRYGKATVAAESLLQALTDRPWEGNIPELHNTVERMYLLSDKDVLDAGDLPLSAAGRASGGLSPQAFKGYLHDVLEEVEERMILDALRQTGGNQSRAAELLGISRNALIYKMKRIR